MAAKNGASALSFDGVRLLDVSRAARRAAMMYRRDNEPDAVDVGAARIALYDFLGDDTEISIPGENPDFEAALDALIRAAQAEMPCYYVWTDELPDCENANDQEDTCPPCEARTGRDKMIGSARA